MNKEQFCFIYDTLQCIGRLDDTGSCTWHFWADDLKNPNYLPDFYLEEYTPEHDFIKLRITPENLPKLKSCFLEEKLNKVRFAALPLFMCREKKYQPSKEWLNFNVVDEKAHHLFFPLKKEYLDQTISWGEKFYSEENAKFLSDILTIVQKYDLFDEIFWGWANGDDEFMHFTILCNDSFYYASADGECVTKENIDLLRQSCEDIKKIHCENHWASLLFCARVRKMQPLPYYMDLIKDNTHLYKLFTEL